jgi:hypothetical protein
MLNVRLIKMLGLAAVAALAAMAFLGAGTASADSACLEDVGVTGECPANKIWTGPIIGLSASAVLSSSALNVLCKSEFLANYVKNEGSHVGVLYLITLLDFTNCDKCKPVIAENLPYLALASALKEHVIVNEDGKGHPAALLEACEVLGFKVNCLYEAAEPLLKYLLEKDEKGNSFGSFDAIEVPLLRGGDSALCPKEGKWNAAYLIYEDEPGPKEGAPLFLTALP